MMTNFAFHPELFEVRSQVLEILSENGITQYVDYVGVDVEHTHYGFEVTGIRDEQTGHLIKECLWDLGFHEFNLWDIDGYWLLWMYREPLEEEEYGEEWNTDDG